MLSGASTFHLREKWGAMTTSDRTYDKLEEHRRIFDTLPNVLIQDPARGRAYYIKAEELAGFRTTPATWARLNDATVSFVIPDGEMIDEVPSFLRVPEVDPSVLIRYSRLRSSYFLTFEDLQRFAVSRAVLQQAHQRNEREDRLQVQPCGVVWRVNVPRGGSVAEP